MLQLSRLFNNVQLTEKILSNVQPDRTLVNLFYLFIYEFINTVYHTIFVVVQSFDVFGFVEGVDSWPCHLFLAKIMKEMVILFRSRLPFTMIP